MATFSKLTFARVAKINSARCAKWHADGSDPWTMGDWGNAMAGEAGEVCNAIKKLRRIETGLRNINAKGRRLYTRDKAVAKIGEELADTFLYLDLIASRLGIDLGDEVVKKFNKTSDQYGFEIKL